MLQNSPHTLFQYARSCQSRRSQLFLGQQGDDYIPRYDPLPQARNRATSLTLWSSAPLSSSRCEETAAGKVVPAVEADSFALQPIKGSCRGMAPSPARVYYTPCQPSWDMVRVEVNEWHPGSTWDIPSSKVLGWVRQEDHLFSGVLGRVEAASRVLTSEQQPQDHSTTKLMTMMTHVENYRRTVLPQQLGAPDTLSRVISASQPLDSSKAAKTDRMSSLTSLPSLAVVGPAKTAAGVRPGSGHPSPVPQNPPPGSVCSAWWTSVQEPRQASPSRRRVS